MATGEGFGTNFFQRDVAAGAAVFEVSAGVDAASAVASAAVSVGAGALALLAAVSVGGAGVVGGGVDGDVVVAATGATVEGVILNLARSRREYQPPAASANTTTAASTNQLPVLFPVAAATGTVAGCVAGVG